MRIVKLFGPPGTGKTYSLLQIMEQELAAGTKPDRIAYLTFTVQARREAIRRVEEKFGYKQEDLINFKTLHAICYRELGMTTSGMVSGTKALLDLGNRLGIAFTPQKAWHSEEMLDIPSGGEVGDQLIRFDHFRRHKLLTLDEALVNYTHDEVDQYQVRYFIDEYERWKQRETLLDFTDLLEQVQHALDVDCVIVDEAQDLSRLQWQTLHTLSQNCQRMYLAGDDDQAIFTWAGASPDAFIDHPGEVRVLPQSYRVPMAVDLIAKPLAHGIKHRQPKEWRPRNVEGFVNRYADTAGVRFDREGKTLVLYRHHYLADDIVEQLRAGGVPYQRNDAPAPGAEWGSSIVFWERLRQGKSLSQREVRAALDGLVIGRGITKEGKQTFLRYAKDTVWDMAALREHCGVLATGPWFEALTKIKDEDKQYLRLIIRRGGSKAVTETPPLRLSTIHAAKGAEADHVVLLTDVSRRVRDTMDRAPDDERRVFYVGVTRAKESLHLVGTDNYLFGG